MRSWRWKRSCPWLSCAECRVKQRSGAVMRFRKSATRLSVRTLISSSLLRTEKRDSSMRFLAASRSTSCAMRRVPSLSFLQAPASDRSQETPGLWQDAARSPAALGASFAHEEDHRERRTTNKAKPISETGIEAARSRASAADQDYSRAVGFFAGIHPGTQIYDPARERVRRHHSSGSRTAL